MSSDGYYCEEGIIIDLTSSSDKNNCEEGILINLTLDQIEKSQPQSCPQTVRCARTSPEAADKNNRSFRLLETQSVTKISSESLPSPVQLSASSSHGLSYKITNTCLEGDTDIDDSFSEIQKIVEQNITEDFFNYVYKDRRSVGAVDKTSLKLLDESVPYNLWSESMPSLVNFTDTEDNFVDISSIVENKVTKCNNHEDTQLNNAQDVPKMSSERMLPFVYLTSTEDDFLNTARNKCTKCENHDNSRVNNAQNLLKHVLNKTLREENYNFTENKQVPKMAVKHVGQSQQVIVSSHKEENYNLWSESMPSLVNFTDTEENFLDISSILENKVIKCNNYEDTQLNNAQDVPKMSSERMPPFAYYLTSTDDDFEANKCTERENHENAQVNNAQDLLKYVLNKEENFDFTENKPVPKMAVKSVGQSQQVIDNSVKIPNKSSQSDDRMTSASNKDKMEQLKLLAPSCSYVKSKTPVLKKSVSTKNKFQHIISPVANYINNAPVATLMKNVHPELRFSPSNVSNDLQIPVITAEQCDKEYPELPRVAYKSAKETELEVILPEEYKLPRNTWAENVASSIPKALVIRHIYRKMNSHEKPVKSQEDSFNDLTLDQADISYCTQKSTFTNSKKKKNKYDVWLYLKCQHDEPAKDIFRSLGRMVSTLDELLKPWV